MTVTPITPEFVAAKAAFEAAASHPGAGIETLFGAWSRWRQASARARTGEDVLAGISFAEVLEGVLACRTGKPFVLPNPRAKP